MYYICESYISLASRYVPSLIKGMVSNKIFSFICVYNETQIFIYEHKSNTLIAFYERSSESLEVYGPNSTLEWSMDTHNLAIGTNKGFLMIYSLTFADNYMENMEGLVNPENGFTVPLSIPTNCIINFIDVITFNKFIHCLSLYRGDLLVATDDGALNRIRWDGQILYNEQMKLEEVSFFNDLEYSKASKSVKCDSSCNSLEWFPSLNGLVILFENGKSAFLHIPNHVLDHQQVTGVWAEHLRHAICMGVNVKFRSVAFGIKSGDGVIYKFDEETGALRIQHRLKISNSEFPDAETNTGGVVGLRWSPDNYCLLMFWESGAFSLWSVQGFLLFSSLGHSHMMDINALNMEWGCEGLSIWAIRKQDQEINDIVIFKLMKSVLINNSTLNNQRHILLVSTNSMLLGFRENLINSLDTLECIKYPELYMSLNWPIKYASINEDASCIGISGKCGFALYFTQTKKWRLFGNEIEESSIEVVGGIIWYKKFICISCYNNKKETFEIRIYNSQKKIEDATSIKHTLNNQILILNSCNNTIVTLSINGLISLYNLRIESGIDRVYLDQNQVISLENYIDFAACVLSLHLSTLHSDIGSDVETDNIDQCNSLLVNYSGHLLMFQRDNVHSKNLKTVKYASQDSTVTNSKYEINFSGPLVVAYDVENIWIPILYDTNKCKHIDSRIYTMENALWINCGAHGLKVWLPLKNNNMAAKTDFKIKNSFLSKRIMLTCNISDFYPLVVLNSNMLLLAPSNEFSHINRLLPCTPNMKIKRHIFIHHIIKQLLRINLGIHALDLTNDLKNLPYFNHALELLLHEILEEEATSKEPIPDPLIPRVIAFIQEFPDFLKTVVQCARKTELALWPYLFESAGDPKDLFESCIENNQPGVAASYLVILQNTEPPFLSQQYAIILIHSSLYQLKWRLVKDLIRFMRNIALNDVKSQCDNKRESSIPFMHLHKRRYRSGGCTAMKKTLRSSIKRKENSFDEVYVEIDNSCSPKYQSVKSTPSSLSEETKSGSHQSTSFSFLAETSDFIEMESIKSSSLVKDLDHIITKFAHELLSEYRLYHLFEMVANVNFSELQFLKWLKRERENCFKIKNPLEAFRRLHKDFGYIINMCNTNSTREPNDMGYTVLKTKVSPNPVQILNRKKLRYVTLILIESKYWNWAIMLSCMLDDFVYMSNILEKVENSDIGILNDFLLILIQNVRESNEFCRFEENLLKLYEKGNMEIFLDQAPNVFNKHLENELCHSPAKDALLLSPCSDHTFTLGQLEIDLRNSKLTENADFNHTTKELSTNSTPYVSKAPFKEIQRKRSRNNTISGSISKNTENLFNSFKLPENVLDQNCFTEPLISIDLEDGSSKGCLLS